MPEAKEIITLKMHISVHPGREAGPAPARYALDLYALDVASY